MPRRKADEHEIHKRREQIIRGARRCLARFGFHATSVQYLERECGLTRSTLFKYFDSKADMLTAVVAAEEACREAQFRAVAQRQDQMDSLAAAVNAFVSTQLRVSRSDPVTLRLRLELLSLAERDARWSRTVRRMEARQRALRQELVLTLMRHDEVHPDWEPEALNDLASAMFLGLAV